MNKDKTKKENGSDSTKHDDIFNIEVILNNIILKNKEKLEKIRLKEMNIEKFSLKNKEGNTVYYLRKKTNKKKQSNMEHNSLWFFIEQKKNDKCAKKESNPIKKT